MTAPPHRPLLSEESLGSCYMLLMTPPNWMKCFSRAGSTSHPPLEPLLLTRNDGAQLVLRSVYPHIHLTGIYPLTHNTTPATILESSSHCSCSEASVTAARLCLAKPALLEDNCGSSANPPRKAIQKWSSEPSTRPDPTPKVPMVPRGCPGLQRGFSSCKMLLCQDSPDSPHPLYKLAFLSCRDGITTVTPATTGKLESLSN